MRSDEITSNVPDGTSRVDVFVLVSSTGWNTTERDYSCPGPHTDQVAHNWRHWARDLRSDSTNYFVSDVGCLRLRDRRIP